MDILIIIVVLGLTYYFVVSHLLGKPRFWKLTRKYPDAAYAWFLKEECWVVQQENSVGVQEPNFPLPRDRYIGPFRIALPRSRRLISVWCDKERIEGSQQRCIESLKP